MDERTTGLILRARPLTETSLIVQWLTKDFGRISTVAKGARGPKSPFLGKLDLFYLAELSFHPSRRSRLHILREVTVREHHEALRRDLGYLRQASYFVHLLEQTTESSTPLPGLFDLLSGVLALLPQHPPAALTVLAFELKLLDELGLGPDLSQASLSSGVRQLLQLLRAGSWTEILHPMLSQPQLDETGRFLDGLLTFHFGQAPRGRSAALLQA